MQRILNGVQPVSPDAEVLCEACEEQPAKWVGLVFRGTSIEPPEYVYLCDEHGGSDE